MITISVLSMEQKPFGEALPFQLVAVSADNNIQVISSATMDASGILSFDVDPASIGPVNIRLDLDALQKMDKSD